MDNKCPWYNLFSSEKALFDRGDDCIGADCNYWLQSGGVGECEIKTIEQAKVCAE